MQGAHEKMHPPERIGLVGQGVARENVQFLAGMGRGRVAQKNVEREFFTEPAHDAGGVVGFDHAFRRDGHAVERAVVGTGMDDIAESVLAAAQGRVRQDVNPPVPDLLAVESTRRKPEDLVQAANRFGIGDLKLKLNGGAHGAGFSTKPGRMSIRSDIAR